MMAALSPALLLTLMAAHACAEADRHQVDSPAECELRAFVSETDPEGLNVRDAPSLAAHVLGRLPPGVTNLELGHLAKVEVNVLASKTGWLLIDRARDNSALTGRPPRRMFSGRGWVSGSKITVKSQASQAHAGPGRDTPVFLRDTGSFGFDNDAMIAASHVLGCLGSWARLEIDLSRLPGDYKPQLEAAPAAKQGLRKDKLRAWVDQICGNQETSCDGLSPGFAPASPTQRR